MLKKVDRLIKKYSGLYLSTVNPDCATWKDLGLSKNEDGCKTPTEWLATHEEFDEGQQTSMAIYGEILDDLRKLKKAISKIYI